MVLAVKFFVFALYFFSIFHLFVSKTNIFFCRVVKFAVIFSRNVTTTHFLTIYLAQYQNYNIMFFQSPCTTDVSLFLWETSSDEQNCFVLIRARLLPFSSPRLAIPLVNVVCLCFTYIFTKRLCINKTLCSHWL